MKKLSIILVVFYFLAAPLSYSQNSLDTMIFNRINEYRQDYGKTPLVWDSLLYKMADQNLSYMMETSTLPNDGSQPTPISKYDNFPSYYNRVFALTREDPSKVIEISLLEVELHSWDIMALSFLGKILNSDNQAAHLLDPELKGIWISTGFSSELIVDGQMTYNNYIYCEIVLHK